MNITTARSRSGIRLAPAARLITTLLHEMEQQDARYGLSTMCIGHGMGVATIIERVGN